MKVAFCANCAKYTGHKRSIGVGTALGAVVTGGVSLLAVPAYGERCVICGLTESEATQAAAKAAITPAQAAQAAADTALGKKYLVYALLAIIFIALIWIAFQ